MKAKTWLIIILTALGAGFAWRWYRWKYAYINPELFEMGPASESQREWLSPYSYRDKRTGKIVYIEVN